MKIKYTALMLALVLSFGTIATSCSSSNTVQEDTLTSREVDFSNIGLKYTTPESWQDFTKSNNLYPYSYEEDYSIENIRYNYITPEDWKTVTKESAKNGNFSLNDYLYPICEIVVVQTENASKLESSGLYSTFSSRDLIKENNGVSYYLFYDYVGSTRKMGEDNLEDYEAICNSVSELASSFVITDFDVKSYVEAKYAEKNTVTFSTQTIDGKNIDSSVFGNYDLTLFYVWGTYLYPDVDNIAEIEKAYEYAKTLGNVNVVAVCIDTPDAKLDDSEKAKELVNTAKDLLTKGGAKFDVIRLDSNMASFVQTKFKSIPAFAMVDKKGIVRGGYNEGVYTGEQYQKFIDAALKSYVTNADTTDSTNNNSDNSTASSKS